MSAVHVARSGQGKPLVFIHGWGFDSRVWQSLLPILNSRYDVYCVDLPGFGLSPVMDWESFKQSLMIQLPTQFALAGWSLGGMVATRLLIDAPHRVTHLVSIASSPRFVSDEGWPGVSMADLVLFEKRLTDSPGEVLQEFSALQLPGVQQVIPLSPTLDGLKMGLDWLMHWDFREALPQINVPVLYLFGRLDDIIPRQIKSVMQTQFPAFHYVMLSKAAHALFISHSDKFIEILDDFL